MYTHGVSFISCSWYAFWIFYTHFVKYIDIVPTDIHWGINIFHMGHLKLGGEYQLWSRYMGSTTPHLTIFNRQKLSKNHKIQIARKTNKKLIYHDRIWIDEYFWNVIRKHDTEIFSNGLECREQISKIRSARSLFTSKGNFVFNDR